jgi:hydroxyacylglutathione hydrolase
VDGTLHIPAGGSFVTWAGWLLPYDEDFYLVVRDGGDAVVAELVRQLALIGLDRVAGVFTADALDRAEAAGARLSQVPQVAPEALAALVAAGDVDVLDVRHPREWATGHIRGAVHIPLGYLEARRGDLPTGRPLVVHCQGGTRSAIAASLLRRHGRTDVTNLPGGFTAWHAAGLPEEGGSTPA